GTNTVLDLIEPLGFQIDNKKMKRAGLDYWDKDDIRMHDDLEAFLNTLGPNDEMYLISKFSSKNYAQVDYTRSEEHTSELQSRFDLVCRLMLEKKNQMRNNDA